MNINFNKVKIKNFLSYGESEIDLRDKGYCLVSGVNNYAKDNALSNGSGKSSWTSAICWALTGETINGITQNIKNINIDENLCYVTLEFTVNKDSYKITRYKEPKPDLKIIINDEDKSGKGIRESEAILAQYLPDLTTNLIASIIILGQGLPCKFSNNTPSGRKDVLEKLSKSDFMINDLKNRLNNRMQDLNNQKRKFEDAILSAESKKSVFESQIQSLQSKLEELEKPQNFDKDIEDIKLKIQTLEKDVKSSKDALNEAISNVTSLNNKLTTVLTERANKLNLINKEYTSLKTDYVDKKYKLEADIKSLNSEIIKLKSLKDVCPTCGQKIPGVVKPDTTEKENNLKQLQESLSTLNSDFSKVETKHTFDETELTKLYKDELADLNSQIDAQNKINQDQSYIVKVKDGQLNQLRSDLLKIETKKQNYLKDIDDTKKAIESAHNNIKLLENEILYNKNEKDIISNHLNVLNQMNTLIKRDFRGFLLSNIISFINKKAKEYSKDIFGTEELDFVLDGNNIDITYCNKNFESLSGGEKQKVDLIIQFAIRNMMTQYLDFSSNILVLDEITDNLDTIGCNNVLNLISKKLDDIESIFIISHHADELAIPADCEMVIVKDTNGISRVK